jgi:hypothetical protein
MRANHFLFTSVAGVAVAAPGGRWREAGSQHARWPFRSSRCCHGRCRPRREAVPELPNRPYPSVEGIKKLFEIYTYREMRIHKPEDFYDASFVTALDKSGYIDGLYKTAKQR